MSDETSPENAPPPDRDPQSDRVSRLPLLIMGSVVGILVLVTLALLASRKSASFPDGSPEAALQEFVATALDGSDQKALLAMLTPEVRSRCTIELRDDNYSSRWQADGDLRAQLDSIEIEGDRASAIVRLRRLTSDDPFGGSWASEHDFELVVVNGAWLIERASWPYPFDYCTRSVD